MLIRDGFKLFPRVNQLSAEQPEPNARLVTSALVAGTPLCGVALRG
jgi:hypothetical protein